MVVQPQHRPICETFVRSGAARRAKQQAVVRQALRQPPLIPCVILGRLLFYLYLEPFCDALFKEL